MTRWTHARTNAATDGPWEAEYSGEQGNCVLPPDARSTREAVAVTRLYYQVADAEFIAAARTDLPAATTALRAVLDLLDQVDGEDEWSLVHTEDVRSAITAALESVK